jgi:aspartate aminotransferase-like enzyme
LKTLHRSRAAPAAAPAAAARGVAGVFRYGHHALELAWSTNRTLSVGHALRTLAAGGWTVATGIEPDEERLIRIGHMGDLMPAQVAELLAEIEPLL